MVKQSMEDNKNILDHLKVKKPDSPGEDYFAALAQGVINSQKEEVKVIPLYKKPSFWMSAAAASIIVVLLFNINGSPGEKDVLLALNDIPSATIQSYVEDNIDDFDTDLIAEYVNEDNLDTDDGLANNEGEDIAINVKEEIKLDDVQQEDILKYFEDEEIDLIDLMEDESFI